MVMAVYSFLLALALGLSAPWWLWRMATSGRYREGLGERLGFVPAGFRAAVAGKKIVWVHAVSVGELLAVERLVAELRAALPGYVVAISTTTATGQKIARERFAGSPVFYFPLDFAFAVRAWLRVVRPSLMVLVESEFWPRHLAECERAGVPVAVVNARVSDRSLPRYMRLRWLWRRVFSKVRLFLAQGEESAERLKAIGADPERVVVSGNLKYDAPGTGENAMARRIGSLLFECRLLVAGSTHDGEEQALLAAWPTVSRAVPDVALVIAPRHPQRLDDVTAMIRAGKPGFFRCSHLLLDTEPICGGMVLLLDTMGDLAAMYGISAAAFIGGSLVPKGGQNPIEAAKFGVPVVMGPFYENFREIVEKMKLERTIRIADKTSLPDALIDALQCAPTGTRNFSGQNGATARTVQALTALTGVPQRLRPGSAVGGDGTAEAVPLSKSAPAQFHAGEDS